MRYYEINGLVGGITPRPCTIFCAESRGKTWYVAEGGTLVNRTYEEVEHGKWIEELDDFDCFTTNNPIKSLEDLEKALEE
jgi:hypothetical protein